MTWRIERVAGIYRVVSDDGKSILAGTELLTAEWIVALMDYCEAKTKP